MTAVTKKQWRARWKEVYKKLSDDHPATSPKWRFEMAHKIMRNSAGPEPPGLVMAALKAAFAVKVKGEGMEFKWSKASRKGLRAAVGSALAIAAVAFGEGLISAADTKEELLGLGAPAVLIPVLLGLGAMARNWLKQKKKAREAGDYVTPPQS